MSSAHCQRCGFENPPGLRFCGNCGSLLAAAPPSAEERRLVTVLFADVTGSTALGEALDPEDLRALLARYYAIAREVVIAHGGSVAKFIGDAVMAVFGLPQAHGDDARRALSAALELRDRVRDDPRLGERLPIRLGVNTGEVVATRDPLAGEFLITGDAVNVAARLEQSAEPWSILCGERTASAAGEVFEFGPPTSVDARGKSAPVPARLVLGRAAPALARRAPLVGRRSDLAQLELVAGRAFGEARPFLVSLIAPAGTGKTRLLEEFLDRLPGLAPGASVAIAQCLPYGQRLTYWPLRAVLYALARISEDERPEATREAIRAWLRECRVDGPERTAELLAATVGLGETEGVDRTALFAAWRTAVEAASRRAPLMLAFEDLHWSSDSLLDLVEFVMQPRGDSAVLMIALARPELIDRRPAWGGGRRNYVSLVLEPLAEAEMAELVEHLLGAPTPEIVAPVVARAEGNPFYAGEIVRSVLERVSSLQNREAVERALAALPDTVQATVLARIDLLEPDERRVLQLGSVFGRVFRPAGIAALAPALSAGAGDLAERLAGKDLIRPSDTDGFAFRHILIREVAYQTLPRTERARLHAAAGDWLEADAAGREDELAELIAYHYREAATLTGPLEEDDLRAGEIRRKAVVWLARAAEVAAAGAAMGEAARHLRAAIELAELGDLPQLYERLGNVTAGNDSAEAYRTALRLCREAGKPTDQELRVLASLLLLYTRFQGSVSARPSSEELERLRAEGRALLPDVTDERALASFLLAEAFVPFWHSHYHRPTAAELAEAEACALQGLEIAERLDDVRLRSAALDAMGSLTQHRGGWEASRRFNRQRLELQDRLDLIERLDAHSMVTWASALLGDLGEADRVSADGLALVQPRQASGWALHLAAWRMYALTLLGRWNEVSALAERAHQLWVESENRSAGYAIRGFVAALDVARARQDEELSERCRDILRGILETFDAESFHGRMRAYLVADLEALEAGVVRPFGFSQLEERVERVLSLCADRARPPSPEVVRPILDFASAGRLRILEAQCHRALGLALRDATEHGRALELFESAGAMPYAARARCERALLTGDEAELAAGMRDLEALGDLEQLARYESAKRGES